jgi:hypothetical protein
VAQPAVGAKRDIEEQRGEHAARDEERLEVGRAHVADVGDVLALGHGGVVDAVL